MKIAEMKAKDRGREVRIFVSERMKNESGNWGDDRPIRGYWYAVKGGSVGYFVTRRPHSGCSLQAWEKYEEDVFNVNDPMNTKEEFESIVLL